MFNVVDIRRNNQPRLMFYKILPLINTKYSMLIILVTNSNIILNTTSNFLLYKMFLLSNIY